MHISVDDLRGEDVRALLEEHRRSMFLYSPAASVHALDVEGLRVPEITFWVAREGGALLGCGALRELDAESGEIKSMRTAAAHVRKGVAAAVLGHIVQEARKRRYTRLYLEAGTADSFAPALRLYARAGFVTCAPFGNYVPDPYSTCMCLVLDQPD